MTPARGAQERNSPADRRRDAQALPPLGDADAAAIEAFLDATWAESGLARQSLAGYRRDLEGFARWRDGAGGGLAGADRAALFDYLAYRTGAGYSPRSNARLLSALRAGPLPVMPSRPRQPPRERLGSRCSRVPLARSCQASASRSNHAHQNPSPAASSDSVPTA
jgi:hypothetical protein